MKTCYRCGFSKELSEFYKNKGMTDGHFNKCKDCCKREATSNRKAKLEYYREYDRRRYHNGSHAQKTRNQDSSILRRWRRENPQKAAAQRNRRRALKVNAEGNYTAAEFNELCDIYGGICLCCGGNKPLTADHVIPLSKGGSNSIENIQPLCGSCNSRKGVNTDDYRMVNTDRSSVNLDEHISISV